MKGFWTTVSVSGMVPSCLKIKTCTGYDDWQWAMFLLETREIDVSVSVLGQKLLIGTMRSINTLRLMQKKLPNLLKLMVGRMVLWLSIQTLLAMSTLYFEKEFAMETKELMLPLVIYLVVGVPSAIITSIIVQRREGHIIQIFKVSSHS